MIIAGAHNNYRPRILSWHMVAYCALIFGVLAGLSVQYYASVSEHNFASGIMTTTVVGLTNQFRLESGLQPVVPNMLLATAAQSKANDMAAKGYFAHFTADGMTPWKFMDAAGYRYVYAGENLAVHFAQEKDIVDAWIRSPTHRANLLNPVFHDIGIGVSEGEYQGARGFFVVQMFGTTPQDLTAIPMLDQQWTDFTANLASAQEVLGNPFTLSTIIAAAMILLVALSLAPTLLTRTATPSGLIVALLIALTAIGSTYVQAVIASRVII